MALTWQNLLWFEITWKCKGKRKWTLNIGLLCQLCHCWLQHYLLKYGYVHEWYVPNAQCVRTALDEDVLLAATPMASLSLGSSWFKFNSWVFLLCSKNWTRLTPTQTIHCYYFWYSWYWRCIHLHTQVDLPIQMTQPSKQQLLNAYVCSMYIPLHLELAICNRNASWTRTFQDWGGMLMTLLSDRSWSHLPVEVPAWLICLHPMILVQSPLFSGHLHFGWCCGMRFSVCETMCSHGVFLTVCAKSLVVLTIHNVIGNADVYSCIEELSGSQLST